MEFWSCLSEEKGFVSDETISHTDSLPRNRNAFMDMKIPSTFQSQDFGELGLPEMKDKHQSNDPVRDEVLSDKVYGERNTTNNTTSMASPNLFSGEDESSSRLSSSIMESNNSRDSSLFDLKLGRLADNRDAYSSMLWKGSSVLSSSESSTPPKRMRVSGVYSQSTAACCQVYGCNKDLSSSKDYHKRHKVCETHSKTDKAIVKGIEQRFCQQCSRFHLLEEFDEGKRSCRKRLAGHNERRRKPQGGIHFRRAERLLQSYNASRFGGSTLTTASFICQDILPSAILDPENYRASDWCRQVKVEDGTQFRPLSGVPVTNGHLHLKSVLPSYEIGKQYPPDRENASIFSDTGSQFPHDLRGLNSASHSIFQETSLGGENYNVINTTAPNYNVINTTAPNVQGLSRISDSGFALSLLSSQSQNSPSHSSGIPMARRMSKPVSHTHYSLIQVSDKLMEGCSQASSSGFSNKHPSLSPMMISSGTDTDDFGISDGIFQGSHFVNNRDSRLSCNGGTTVDLIQLSSQLQRVQDQRQSQQVKQGNDAFCRLRIT